MAKLVADMPGDYLDALRAFGEGMREEPRYRSPGLAKPHLSRSLARQEGWPGHWMCVFGTRCGVGNTPRDAYTHCCPWLC